MEIKITYLKKVQTCHTSEDSTIRCGENAALRWHNGLKEYRIVSVKDSTYKVNPIPLWVQKRLFQFPVFTHLIWHKKLYQSKGRIYNYITQNNETITRKHADQLFFAIMLRMGFVERHAQAIYRAARLWGRFAWIDFSKGWYKRIF